MGDPRAEERGMTLEQRRRAAAPAALAAARAVLDSAVPEKDFQATVLQLANLHGWAHFHTYDSRRSTPGFPDLVLVRPPRVLFVELKSEHGELSRHQQAWLNQLRRCPGVGVHVWKPSDWQTVEEVLGG